MKEAITYEKAEAEVTAWLDRKKIPVSRRTGGARVPVDNMIEAVQYGHITIADDGTIKQILQFPLEDSTKTVFLEELNYKARSSTDAVIKIVAAQRVQTDETGLLARLAELTDRAFGHIVKLVDVDMTIAKSIGVFFTS